MYSIILSLIGAHLLHGRLEIRGKGSDGNTEVAKERRSSAGYKWSLEVRGKDKSGSGTHVAP
jgi:hypothetical protein